SVDTRSALTTHGTAPRPSQTKWAPAGAATAPLRTRDKVRAGSPRPMGSTQFRPGDKVRHTAFGDGLVIQSESRGDDEEVTVIFVGQKPKKLLQSFANLQKI